MSRFYAVTRQNRQMKVTDLSYIWAIQVKIVKEREIQNHFLELLQLRQGDALTVFETIIDFFEKNDVDSKRTRFPGMDGCTVMAGEHNGLKSRIGEVVPCFMYLHCVMFRTFDPTVQRIWKLWWITFKFVFIIEEQKRETIHIWRSAAGIQFVIPLADKSSGYSLVKSWSSRKKSFRSIRATCCYPWCDFSAQTRTSSSRFTQRLD